MVENELTKREKEVLDLILEGKTTCEIKNILGLAKSTIRTYYKYIYSKMYVASKIELILKCKNEI